LSRASWIVAAIAVTTLTVALAVVLSATANNSVPTAQQARAGLCPSPSGARVVKTVPMPGQPGFMLLQQNALWVAIAGTRIGGPGSILRLDARSGRVLQTYRLPFNPYRLAVGFGSLWVTGEVRRETRRLDGTVLRIDTRSGRLASVIRGPKLLGASIAATSDGIWVGGGDVVPRGHPERAGVRWVYKIDPRQNAVVRRVRMPITQIDLVGDGSAVWVTGWGGVVKLSSSGRLLRLQRFGGSGWSMTLTPGAVWVGEPWFGGLDRRQDRPARRLLKVSTSGPHRLTVIELERQPGDVSAAGGIVWVGINGLARLAAGGAPPALERVPVDVAPNRIEAFPGGAWVDELRSRNLSKIC
jgi:hypothetical protein